MLVAFQMILGVRRLRLPALIGRRQIPLSVVEAIISSGRPWVERIEARLSFNRLPPLTGQSASMALGVLVFLLAFLIALPIPFGNTLPALTVIAIALALAHRDGAVVLASLVMAVAAGAVSYWLALAAGDLLARAFG